MATGTERIKGPRLPVTVRLPLLAAVMIFVAAVASTQTAIHFMGRQAERQVETLGQVYLDGLSAALLPHAQRADHAGIAATLRQALSFHDGVVDRRLAFAANDGSPPVEARRTNTDAGQALPEALQAALAAGPAASGLLRMPDDALWIWRPLVLEGHTYGTVAADLDVSSLVAERGLLRGLLLLSDLLFSGACAVLGFFMVRRMQRPVTTVAQRLYEAALGRPRPIEPQDMPADDQQAEHMMHAFNAMAYASSERENLLDHLAQQQREADLGRLTATVAHEVRNPLGGMRTAISTLQRFGDQADAREQAVGFLERGVSALEQVVDATLENHRVRPQWRPLLHQDFEDLRLLVQADGRSRGVQLQLQLDVPASVPVPALEVRQVLLNLLLNAVRASQPGGHVALQAQLDGGELLVRVQDEGSGLERSLARDIERGTVAPDAPGIGVAVVIRLVARLQGRVAIESAPGTGTQITLRLPLQAGEEAA